MMAIYTPVPHFYMADDLFFFIPSGFCNMIVAYTHPHTHLMLIGLTRYCPHNKVFLLLKAGIGPDHGHCAYIHHLHVT